MRFVQVIFFGVEIHTWPKTSLIFIDFECLLLINYLVIPIHRKIAFYPHIVNGGVSICLVLLDEVHADSS